MITSQSNLNMNRIGIFLTLVVIFLLIGSTVVNSRPASAASVNSKSTLPHHYIFVALDVGGVAVVNGTKLITTITGIQSTEYGITYVPGDMFTSWIETAWQS